MYRTLPIDHVHRFRVHLLLHALLLAFELASLLPQAMNLDTSKIVGCARTAEKSKM